MEIFAGPTAIRGGFVMDDAADTPNTIALTAEIVAAYVSNNTGFRRYPGADQSGSHGAAAGDDRRGEAPSEPLKPAVPIKRSINPDFIVCLTTARSSNRSSGHLRTQYNMTPEQYREKWSLPGDYPMVAPNYAAARSQLAKQMGLGQQRPRRR